MGIIAVNYVIAESKNCGDIPVVLSGKLFSTIELARRNKDNESCYVEDGIRRKANFIFAFQKKWVFKDVVIADTNERHGLFYLAFGEPNPGWFHVEDNNFWRISLLSNSSCILND